MPGATTFLAQLLGTTTKVRIFEQLCLDPTPLSRHALSRAIGAGTGATYEQVDQLIALGALAEVKGAVRLDPAFPFLDDLANLAATTAHYLDDLRLLLERLDALLGSGYYLTGYLAARQYGAPLDYEQDSALVALYNPNPRSRRFLEALSAATATRLDWFEVPTMPPDITRETIYGATVWLASLEQGLVDCVARNDCGPYATVLLLLQNLHMGHLDWQRLMSAARSEGVADFFLATGAELNAVTPQPLVELSPVEAARAEGQATEPLRQAVNKAYNTLMEG